MILTMAMLWAIVALEVVKMPRRIKAVGYVRVSTEEQAREGLSLDAQEEKIKAYCTAKGWRLVRIYRDEGFSGKDLNRPGLQAMLRDLKSDGIRAVVVAKLDRLTRSVRDLGYLIDDLFDGVALASVEESLDTTTAGGRFVLHILGAVAQWERETISERTRNTLRFKRQRGEWVGRVPYGFKIGPDGRLVEDPEQIRNIQRMKRLRRRGYSYREIAERFGLSVGLVHKIVHTDLRKLRRAVGVV